MALLYLTYSHDTWNLEEKAGCQHRQDHPLWPDGEADPTFPAVYTPLTGQHYFNLTLTHIQIQYAHILFYLLLIALRYV